MLERLTGDKVRKSLSISWLEQVRSSGRVVERRTVNRGDGGSMPPTAVSKLRQFRSPHICLCLSEEEVKDPIKGVNV